MTTAKDKQVGGGHYKDMAIQPYEYCERNNLSFLESTAIKYISRHRVKNGKEDVLKAIHALELLIEEVYDKKETPHYIFDDCSFEDCSFVSSKITIRKQDES